MARKARALWISLHQLGVVRNSSEQAFEAFACRQLGCEKLVWARQSDAFKLIEALKAMGLRAGWKMVPDVEGFRYSVRELQEQLCQAILRRLKKHGVAPAFWTIDDAAWRLCGIENAQERGWTAEDYGRLAAALGGERRKFAPVDTDAGEQA